MTQPKINLQMTPHEWGLLMALSVIWGSSFFFQGYAVRELPPLTIVWLRVALAAVTMVIIVKLIGQRVPLYRHTILPFFGLGFIGLVLPFSLLVWAQTHIPSSVASILNALTPIAIMLVAQVFTTDEKMNVRKVAGMITGITGVTIMIGPEALSNFGDHVIAELACVGACLCYGFASVFGRRFSKFDLKPAEIATGQCITASIILLPIIFWVEAPLSLPMPSLNTWGAVIGLAVISTAFAYMLYFRILATAGATNIGLVTLLVPVTAISLGILVLGEVLEVKHMIGAAGIALGLLILDGRVIARLRAKPSDPAGDAKI